MTSSAIEVENLSKEYRLGVLGYGSLIADFQSFLAQLRGQEDPNSKINTHLKKTGALASRDGWFWALKDINLNIKEGEMLGIIGRNGAGKSTLLKILSRVTLPSQGQVKIRGRVTSLLEVGTGFHPELTGRENVYLNGAIYGLTRAEIKKRFDEIVEFSDVGAFIDTPVKRYSSGMYVRLAFGVAAHLDPEILIVDEVLAVGDALFQKKCLDKMNEVTTKQGRTILFVSHNIGAVMRLCSRAVLLRHGQVVADGDVKKTIDNYLHGDTEVPGERVWNDLETAPGYDNSAWLKAVRVLDSAGKVKTVFDVKEPFFVEAEFVVTKEKYINDVHLYFRNEIGQNLFVAMRSQTFSKDERPDQPGHYRMRCKIPGNFLNEGLIRVEYMLGAHPNTFQVCTAYDAIAFTLTDDRTSQGSRGEWMREWPEAALRPKLEMEFEKLHSKWNVKELSV